MSDPATTSAGSTYERRTIERWLRRKAKAKAARSLTDPLTEVPIGRQLVPNRALRDAILEWRRDFEEERRRRKRRRTEDGREGSSGKEGAPATGTHTPVAGSSSSSSVADRKRRRGEEERFLDAVGADGAAEDGDDDGVDDGDVLNGDATYAAKAGGSGGDSRNGGIARAASARTVALIARLQKEEEHRARSESRRSEDEEERGKKAALDGNVSDVDAAGVAAPKAGGSGGDSRNGGIARAPSARTVAFIARLQKEEGAGFYHERHRNQNPR